MASRQTLSRAPSTHNCVDEVVLSALGIAGVQFHLSSRPTVEPCTSGNRQYRVGRVKERTFYSNLPPSKEDRPEALPGFTGNSAHTVTIVATNLLLIVLIEDRIGKGKNITTRI